MWSATEERESVAKQRPHPFGALSRGQKSASKQEYRVHRYDVAQEIEGNSATADSKPEPALLGCWLVSLHFQWDILSTFPVKLKIVGCTIEKGTVLRILLLATLA